MCGYPIKRIDYNIDEYSHISLEKLGVLEKSIALALRTYINNTSIINPIILAQYSACTYVIITALWLESRAKHLLHMRIAAFQLCPMYMKC